MAHEKWNIQGEPKNGLFLSVDNLATVSGRKVCDMSKVSEFCLTCIPVHLNILCLICVNFTSTEVMTNLTVTCGFNSISNRH